MMGAKEISRDKYLERLRKAVASEVSFGSFADAAGLPVTDREIVTG